MFLVLKYDCGIYEDYHHTENLVRCQENEHGSSSKYRVIICPVWTDKESQGMRKVSQIKKSLIKEGVSTTVWKERKKCTVLW